MGRGVKEQIIFGVGLGCVESFEGLVYLGGGAGILLLEVFQQLHGCLQWHILHGEYVL